MVDGRLCPSPNILERMGWKFPCAFNLHYWDNYLSWMFASALQFSALYVLNSYLLFIFFHWIVVFLIDLGGIFCIFYISVLVDYICFKKLLLICDLYFYCCFYYCYTFFQLRRLLNFKAVKCIFSFLLWFILFCGWTKTFLRKIVSKMVTRGVMQNLSWVK